jgi:hypothetical protein
MTDAHFDRLLGAYRAAVAAASTGDTSGALRELARFHYRFVRLHPFRCANQSLAMNLVNLVLARAVGAGMPHLLLDQLALRLTEGAYERIFELAAGEYASSGEPLERWRVQREKKSRAYALIERLQKCATQADAQAVARSDPTAAREALLLG